MGTSQESSVPFVVLAEPNPELNWETCLWTRSVCAFRTFSNTIERECSPFKVYRKPPNQMMFSESMKKLLPCMQLLWAILYSPFKPHKEHLSGRQVFPTMQLLRLSSLVPLNFKRTAEDSSNNKLEGRGESQEAVFPTAFSWEQKAGLLKPLFSAPHAIFIEIIHILYPWSSSYGFKWAH